MSTIARYAVQAIMAPPSSNRPKSETSLTDIRSANTSTKCSKHLIGPGHALCSGHDFSAKRGSLRIAGYHIFRFIALTRVLSSTAVEVVVIQ